MAQVRIPDAPDAPDFVRFKEGFGQKFLLTVDTEEEFDWRAPFARDTHSIDTVPALRKFLQFCEGLGVAPVFLVDYPIATSSTAAECLKEAVQAGRAEVGVQLHPWVNPPNEEEVNEFNSFAGNLPPELERAKFLRLRDAIEKNFGMPPRIYRAGRYGTGPNTAAILSEGGIAIDTSVRACFDYSSTGGPNLRDHPVRPYWLDRQAGLLELPLTTVYWGMLRQFGAWLYPRMWRVPQLRGILARLGFLDRIPLTPEGVSIVEAINGIDIALDMGLPVLVLSFHSPSLAPGYTPYVRTYEDLDAFYDWWRAIFAHLARRGVPATSVAEIMSSAELA
ncbi:MAG: polysaccharide deacetylase family protein [Novosphingobium sp.]